MLNLAASPATVTGWTSPEWDGSDPAYPYQCATVEPFYIQAAAWSPDDSTIYIGTTGYHPNGWPVGRPPVTGCATPPPRSRPPRPGPAQLGQLHRLRLAVLGGRRRQHRLLRRARAVVINPSDCDARARAVAAPGFEGLSARPALLTFNPTRGRGLGADDMLDTTAGLWIASDNQNGASQCAGKSGRAGICFLPYS